MDRVDTSLSADSAGTQADSTDCIALPSWKSAAAAANLQKLWHVDNETCSTVRADIRKLIKQFFVLDKRASRQHVAVESLKRSIVEKHPDIFVGHRDSEGRLDGALIYAFKNHASSTFLDRSVKSQALKSNLADKPRPSSSPLSVRRKKGRPTKRTIPHANPVTSSNIKDENTALPVSQTSSPLPSTPLSAASIPSISSTSSPSSDAPTSPPSSQPVGTNTSEIAGLRRFLQSCEPPMEHFITRFVAFGCHSVQLLNPVRKWPSTTIDTFLRNLPSGQGREMTEMEVLILRMHILEYFK